MALQPTWCRNVFYYCKEKKFCKEKKYCKKKFFQKRFVELQFLAQGLERGRNNFVKWLSLKGQGDSKGITKRSALTVDSGISVRFMKLEEGVVCSHPCYRGFERGSLPFSLPHYKQLRLGDVPNLAPQLRGPCSVHSLAQPQAMRSRCDPWLQVSPQRRYGWACPAWPWSKNHTSIFTSPGTGLPMYSQNSAQWAARATACVVAPGHWPRLAVAQVWIPAFPQD